VLASVNQREPDLEGHKMFAMGDLGARLAAQRLATQQRMLDGATGEGLDESGREAHPHSLTKKTT